MYGRVFEGHAEGALILEDLVARFYDVNVFKPGGVEGARETDRRAARREVVHFILHMIGQVKEPPPDDDSQPAA
jgi:hypothetical protein